MTRLVIKKILEAIHFIIEKNGYTLTDKQKEKADNEIIPYLQGNLNINDSNIIHPGSPEYSLDKRIYPAVMKYFSITQGNEILYDELLDEDYEFMERQSVFKFYSLDRKFSNHFKKSEFENILLKYDDPVRNFYISLRGLDQKEKEEYYEKFSYIVHKDLSTLKVGYNPHEDNHSFNFLTMNNIKYFGCEYLLNTNHVQREIINSIHFRVDDKSISYIKNILEKYPDSKNIISFDSSFIGLFTEDELLNMSSKDNKLYKLALEHNLFSRMKEILSINPDFDCPRGFIREEVFKTLTNEEILNLSDEAIDKISKIKVKEIDNVIVMPIRKINKIVFMDKTKRKIEEITHSRSK